MPGSAARLSPSLSTPVTSTPPSTEPPPAFTEMAKHIGKWTIKIGNAGHLALDFLRLRRNVGELRAALNGSMDATTKDTLAALEKQCAVFEEKAAAAFGAFEDSETTRPDSLLGRKGDACMQVVFEVVRAIQPAGLSAIARDLDILQGKLTNLASRLQGKQRAVPQRHLDTWVSPGLDRMRDLSGWAQRHQSLLQHIDDQPAAAKNRR